MLYRALLLFLLVLPLSLQAETLRVAVFNTELSRKGPGLLLRDILNRDPQVEAVVATLAAPAPDVVLLCRVDYDLGLQALTALTDRLREAGLDYPHVHSSRPNSGMMTALDLDGDGRRGTPDDAQGYGRFAGAGGMAILSRHPLGPVQDHSDFRWPDLPRALLPERDGASFPSAAVLAQQRLASTAIWDVAVETPQGPLHLLAFHAGPPLFGGPQDRNLRRNHDEVAFWTVYLDGELPMQPPVEPFVILGDANLDPVGGSGMNGVIQRLLAHPALQDPHPGLPTVEWESTGPLRVAYALPDARLGVVVAGVTDPHPSLRHRLVWVDLALPMP